MKAPRPSRGWRTRGISLKHRIAFRGGKATLKTVQGETLTAMEVGGKSMVTIADMNRSTGVIHVVDTVLLPK